eukprot:403353535
MKGDIKDKSGSRPPGQRLSDHTQSTKRDSSKNNLISQNDQSFLKNEKEFEITGQEANGPEKYAKNHVVAIQPSSDSKNICNYFELNINSHIERKSVKPTKMKLNFGKDQQNFTIDQKKKQNSVKTTKYSLLTWAPLSLLFQFKRAANIYFLIISILTCLSFSPKNPISMIGTFAAVLIFTMLKEAYEDIQRFKSDNELNNRNTQVLDYKQHSFQQQKWANLKMGDVVMVQKDKEFPSDLLLLYAPKEIIYVDTMNLDGETNLKEKNVFAKEFDLPKILQLQGELVCDLPNESLDDWDCNIKINETKTLNCKGCYLRNIDYCIGLVMYVGKESKIMMNAKKPPKKISNIMKKMNNMLYTVFGFQFVLIIVYASIKLLKLTQAYLIGKDLSMYDVETNQFGMCRNSDLIEELGQVDFVFSDKTGTLTQNKMIFKKCTVGNQVYGEHETKQDIQCLDMAQSSKQRIFKNIFGSSLDNIQGKLLQDFFTMLAVCHTCMVEKDPITNDLKYSASSPDELTLVQGAKEVGIEFIKRTISTITIKLNNKITESYDQIVEFPFDSTRKRMSLIVKNNECGQYFLMTKGADSIMMPRLKLTKEDQQQLENDLYKFACDGLRTLVFGIKNISQQKVEEFMTQFNDIKTSIDPKKDSRLNEIFDKMEYDLNYIGGTAIEDKLQDGVANTIENIMKANIRVWVLTGDKQETAIEIGKSCKLIQQNMREVILTSKNKDDFIARLDTYSQQDFGQKLAIIIDGPTLSFALENKEVSQKFFEFGMRANSVICCRVSPKQKADVVSLAKRQNKYITLSIGDGANDVSMILEAHIGVGIRGKEGTQAVRSADYAISQFRFLEKLLMHHGRLGYIRVSKMICYYFYKNVVLVFTELHFAYWNGFSGQIFFADWLPTLYNAFFTSWLCLFAMMFERDVRDAISVKLPELYHAGQKGVHFNFKIFWKWIILSIIHGGGCYYMCVYLLQDSLTKKPVTYDHWLHSTLAAILSLVIYYITVLLLSTNTLSTFFQPEMNGIFFQIFYSYQPVYILIILPFALLMPDTLLSFGQRIFFPTPSDCKMILMKRGDFEEQGNSRQINSEEKQSLNNSKINGGDLSMNKERGDSSQVEIRGDMKIIDEDSMEELSPKMNINEKQTKSYMNSANLQVKQELNMKSHNTSAMLAFPNQQKFSEYDSGKRISQNINLDTVINPSMNSSIHFESSNNYSKTLPKTNLQPNNEMPIVSKNLNSRASKTIQDQQIQNAKINVGQESQNKKNNKVSNNATNIPQTQAIMQIQDLNF